MTLPHDGDWRLWTLETWLTLYRRDPEEAGRVLLDATRHAVGRRRGTASDREDLVGTVVVRALDNRAAVLRRKDPATPLVPLLCRCADLVSREGTRKRRPLSVGGGGDFEGGLDAPEDDAPGAPLGNGARRPTARQARALALWRRGHSVSEVGQRMDISRQSAQDLLVRGSLRATGAAEKRRNRRSAEEASRRKWAREAVRAAPVPLTDGERRLLEAWAAGESRKILAWRLGISKDAVHQRIYRLRRKLDRFPRGDGPSG